MADLLEGPGGLAPSFWLKKEEITEGRKADRVSKTKPAPTPLAQGLDPPLEPLHNSYPGDGGEWLLPKGGRYGEVGM